MTISEDKMSRESKLILFILILGNFLCLISETVMNVALPNIISNFHVSTSSAQWLTTGYMLIIGISVPISAFLIQRFTLRQLFITAMGLYVVGSFMALITPLFSVLLIARMIQALGTGIVLPLVMSTMLTLVPIHKRGTVIGIFQVAILFAPAIGPVLSGLAIQYYSWRIIFLGLFIAAVVILLFAVYKLKNVLKTSRPTIHIPSVVLSTLGFGGVVYGFSVAGEGSGWSNPFVWITLAIGVIALAVFVKKQTKMESPLISMEPFKSSIFSRSIFLMFLIMMIQFSMMLILPLYFQTAAELSPLETGILMLPGGITLAFTAMIGGRLFDKIGFKPLLIVGLVLLLFILGLFTRISSETTTMEAMILYAFFTIGVGLTVGPVMTLALNQVPKELHAHGSAISNTINQIAGAIGPALYTSVMTMTSQHFIEESSEANKMILKIQGMTKGVHSVYYAALVFAVVSFLLALTLKREKQVETK
ncbi:MULTISPECIES: MDR family MFS transporter [Bacillus]|uniref:Multidrug MFS transporter n=2 Tax=Bacillus TaxID=1386 RepID=A0A0M3R901_9BACI|nr:MULTISPECIES: MDR family MFS transporter [Bacillus]ALC80566.1 multidrug MFS transporter [Bacillus gobiensis]MBP1083653.1 DHA2 family lincomycin resistance protein-like MFS transporter [Bacillus capparidis]MED1094845.1 MDR family MFS transporter [Bacillus capparidis]